MLDIIGRDDDDDPEVLMGADLIDAEPLAARYEDEENLTAAERAAADRTWAFGHVIVDEAQELSQMAWRMLMRRSPVRSMTIVGDVAQTGDLAGLPSWEDALGAVRGGPVAAGRADHQLPHARRDHGRSPPTCWPPIDPALEVPRSVREAGRGRRGASRPARTTWPRPWPRPP